MLAIFATTPQFLCDFCDKLSRQSRVLKDLGRFSRKKHARKVNLGIANIELLKAKLASSQFELIFCISNTIYIDVQSRWWRKNIAFSRSARAIISGENIIHFNGEQWWA